MHPIPKPGARRRSWALAIALSAMGAGMFAPSVAHASGGEASGGDMLTVIALLGTVGVAYLLAHFVLDALQKKILMLAGVEYIVLGVLLGPNISDDMPAFSNLEPGAGHEGSGNLMPIVALAVGWIGLLRGMELSIRRYRSHTSTGATRTMLVQSLVAGGAVALLAQLAFRSGYLFPYGSHGGSGVVGPAEAWMASGLLGCAAAAGSVEPIQLLKARYRLEGPLAEHIGRIAAMSDLLAVAVFGLLFCIFHPESAHALATPSPTEWAVVSVGLGGLLGVLFTPFLGTDDSENGRFLAMVGIIVLASGAAYFLDLSPLFVNLCLGVVLVNTAKQGPQIRATLEDTKKPLTLVLLVFAGALWRPPDPMLGTLVALGYVALRLVGKAAGTSLAALGTNLRGDTYRGLMAHGEVTVAMAVSLRLVFPDGPAIDLAYTAVLVSVIVNDLIAPRVLRGLFVDTGDLRGERAEEAA